ncbi:MULTISPECIES: hypothetical protein [Pectobacterium]|uniref:Prophage protein n=1 Tax=Pectobacterium versatile TaxID=2488639 RepID=A0AAW3RUQ7_9GAMM|nr:MULTISPECIES: hypothetical protein [Pectobacterium]MBA0159691.1 hypothetical protein [Pectobacterium versatile]MCA6917020.1 hypothetical protein [Pectobacterium versatile]POE17096.1 hypothetical protein BV923_22950 [Pectobacterium odoriferum]
MATNAKVVPVLLSKEQVSTIRRLQEQERSKSPLGVAPTIHVIARSLMDKALKDIEVAHG